MPGHLPTQLRQNSATAQPSASRLCQFRPCAALTQEPADFAAAAAEAEADTVCDAELVDVADFVADPVDDGVSSFVGVVSVVPSGDAVPFDGDAEADAGGAAVVGGVVLGEVEVLGEVDVLGLVDGDTVGLLVVGLVVGFVVGALVGVVGGFVVGFGLWSLGLSGSGGPRSGPWTAPSIEP